MTMLDKAEFDRRVNYHAPDEAKVKAHQDVRVAIANTMIFIDTNCPDGREKVVALTKLEEAMFWANAAIARDI